MHTDLQKVVSLNAFKITTVKYLISSDTTEGKINQKNPKTKSYLVKADIKQDGMNCTVAFCVFWNKIIEELLDA